MNKPIKINIFNPNNKPKPNGYTFYNLPINLLGNELGLYTKTLTGRDFKMNHKMVYLNQEKTKALLVNLAKQNITYNDKDNEHFNLYLNNKPNPIIDFTRNGCLNNESLMFHINHQMKLVSDYYEQNPDKLQELIAQKGELIKTTIEDMGDYFIVKDLEKEKYWGFTTKLNDKKIRWIKLPYDMEKIYGIETKNIINETEKAFSFSLKKKEITLTQDLAITNKPERSFEFIANTLTPNVWKYQIKKENKQYFVYDNEQKQPISPKLSSFNDCLNFLSNHNLVNEPLKSALFTKKAKSYDIEKLKQVNPLEFMVNWEEIKDKPSMKFNMKK